jgi:hypothetical protein
MIDPSQLKKFVIRPILAAIGFGGAAAENLLLGTALTESGLVYLHQLGAGPALGLYQCEPATHDDVWVNYLAGHSALKSKVMAMMTPDPPLHQLISNLAYATAICRVHYLRAPAPLPAAGDAAGMARYHKRFYNTAAGATDPAVSIESFRQAIAA